MKKTTGMLIGIASATVLSSAFATLAVLMMPKVRQEINSSKPQETIAKSSQRISDDLTVSYNVSAKASSTVKMVTVEAAGEDAYDGAVAQVVDYAGQLHVDGYDKIITRVLNDFIEGGDAIVPFELSDEVVLDARRRGKGIEFSLIQTLVS